jgi:uncharacterized protein
VHQDGLVHISEMSHTYVKDPTEVVKVHQRVKVTVLEVDIERKRITLSLKGEKPAPAVQVPKRPPAERPKVRPKPKSKPAAHSNKQKRTARPEVPDRIGDRLNIKWG